MSEISTDDIIISIIKYLPVPDLLRATEISKQWYSAYLKDSKSIWEMHTNQVWIESKMTENIPHIEMSLLSRIKRLPLSVIRFNLQRVDVTRCIEKIDYQRMLLAYILFGGRSAVDSTRLRIYYPPWALQIDEHKATYFQSKRDAKRTQIYMSELCMIDWIFHFKSDYGYEEEGIPNATSKFRADYTYYSERFGQTFSWQFRTDRGQERRVQVDQYPPLRSSRLPNGSWMLENQYVFLMQEKPMPAEDLPLMDM